MGKHENFTDLVLWKKARIFRNEIYTLTKKFPKEEKYKLNDQLIRASRSVTANLAEGHGRFHYQENIQYCRIARGSISECLDHIICAYDCKYIDQKQLNYYRNSVLEITKMLNGFIAFLKKSKQKN